MRCLLPAPRKDRAQHTSATVRHTCHRPPTLGRSGELCKRGKRLIIYLRCLRCTCIHTAAPCVPNCQGSSNCGRRSLSAAAALHAQALCAAPGYLCFCSSEAWSAVSTDCSESSLACSASRAVSSLTISLSFDLMHSNSCISVSIWAFSSSRHFFFSS